MNVRVPRPTARALRVDPDMVAILAAAETAGDALTLTGQLDDGLYHRVYRVLAAAGGRWDKRRRAHVFAGGDALAAIEPILVHGTLTLPPDLGWFATPPELAAALVRFAGIRPGAVVLEPSAGEGAIVRALLAVNAQVQAMEIDGDRYKRLLDIAAMRVPLASLCTDFMARVPEPTFDAVVMNPPFAPRSTDAHHVRHAFDFLRPGGRLVAVMSAGVTFRADRTTADLRDLVHGLGGTIEPLPDGSFRPSGTDVRTVLVTVNKPRAGRA